MNDTYTHFGALYRHLENTANKVNFLHNKVENSWKTFSKQDFLLNVRYLTLAFHKKEFEGQNIAIMVSSSAHWLMLDYALMLCGAVSVPIFTNISSKNLNFVFNDANIQTAIIETSKQQALIDNIDTNINVIHLNNVKGYDSFNDLLLTGQKLDKKNPTQFTKLIENVKAEDLATIVYTSGTSGTPKGVELSHSNLISQIHATSQNYIFDKKQDIAFSFLPLAHIFERMVMHFYISCELSIYFADDVQNVGVLLKEVNPTVMTVVPRLLEKVFFKMQLKAMEGSFIKKAIVKYAFYRARTKNPFSKPNVIDMFIDKLVYTKLRLALGTKMRMMIAGGAALSDDLYRFYLNIGIPLYQGYGQTETSPVIASNTPMFNKVGTCGKVFPGVKVKINDEGELLVKGPNVMMGYHNNIEATHKTIDESAWLHTGDLATIDNEGYITLTGRTKELFKTSTGEYVTSVYIEQKLTLNGWFEHAIIVGNAKPYVVALLFIEHEWLGRLATKMNTTPLKALESKKFEVMTNKFISQINVKLNNWEKVRAYRVISDELSIENGDLTPSMKLGKEHLMNRYHHKIEEMYKDHV
jgi:long-chain acyl-CoA synthetase